MRAYFIGYGIPVFFAVMARWCADLRVASVMNADAASLVLMGLAVVLHCLLVAVFLVALGYAGTWAMYPERFQQVKNLLLVAVPEARRRTVFGFVVGVVVIAALLLIAIATESTGRSNDSLVYVFGSGVVLIALLAGAPAVGISLLVRNHTPSEVRIDDP